MLEEARGTQTAVVTILKARSIALGQIGDYSFKVTDNVELRIVSSRVCATSGNLLKGSNSQSIHGTLFAHIAKGFSVQQ